MSQTRDIITILRESKDPSTKTVDWRLPAPPGSKKHDVVPDFRTFAAGAWKPLFLGTRTTGRPPYLDKYPDIRMFGYPDIQIS